MYPLALGVNSEESEFSLIYGMPDLPQATGQEKQEESGSEAVLSITGSDFYEIERIYDRSQEKISGYEPSAGDYYGRQTSGRGRLENIYGIS